MVQVVYCDMLTFGRMAMNKTIKPPIMCLFLYIVRITNGYIAAVG